MIQRFNIILIETGRAPIVLINTYVKRKIVNHAFKNHLHPILKCTVGVQRI